MTVEDRAGVMHAVMCDPPHNGLSEALIEALAAVVDEFERGGANVLVLSSAIPEFFATGADVTAQSSVSLEQLADYRDRIRPPLERLSACRRPSIAAIEGRALGAGLELAMACTLRFCPPSARFAMPGLNLGWTPAAGGTQRLPRLVGPGRALELMLTGREVRGDEALRIGLIERLLYRDVVGESLEIAAALTATPASAMAAAMICVDAARDLPHESGLAVEGAALVSTAEDCALLNWTGRQAAA
jgi:enoyl-CoA hydratase/carnithine racemase